MALRYLSVRQGTKYGPEYTHALKSQVKGLVCLGDDRALRTDFQGWHAKIELFAPWNEYLRPCLFFDLDTYVIGDLSPFETLDQTKFWLIADFNQPKQSESGVMLIPKNVEAIWDDRERLRKMRTDGEFFRSFQHQRLNTISGIYSYKLHAKEKLPEDARIICFHGKPKQPETTGWGKAFWNLHSSPTKNC